MPPPFIDENLVQHHLGPQQVAITAGQLSISKVSAGQKENQGLISVVPKRYVCAAMTMLVYDHLLTLSDEVEHVWKRKRSAVSVLFLWNRYYTLICMILVVSVSVYALYDRNIYVLVYLSALLLGTVGVGIWEVSFPGGGQLRLHYQRINELKGCAFMPSLDLGPLASTFLAADLAFDVSVFILTMLKTRRSLWSDKNLPLLRRLGQDGALAISSSVCIWLFMVIFAPWQVKWMNALPTFCLMATMINRLTISIRVDPVVDLSTSTGAIQEPQRLRHGYSLRQRIWMRIRGRSLSDASTQDDVTAIMARRLSDTNDVESPGDQMAQVL
ncbi:hypothetical protein BU17DRAFT_100040 [Hysterangium stoloniferum]|nr:hypothetical protein BU17DRAFT_100040 [Hysterangium stoloniferum]